VIALQEGAKNYQICGLNFGGLRRKNRTFEKAGGIVEDITQGA